MKKLFTLVLALLSLGVINLSAQTSDKRPIQTLGGGGGSLTVGGYAAGDIKIGGLDGQTAIFMGGHGGLLIGQTVMIGVGAYTLVNDYKAREGALSRYPLSNDVFLNMSYFGPMVEVIVMSNDAIHFGVNTLVGFGSASYSSSGNSPTTLPTGRIALLEPGVFAEVNVTDWFRVAVGGSYRYGINSRLEGYEAKNFNGLNFDLSLKFGKFW